MIEMLWSSSSYLPAHGDGQKYIDMAYRLQELMAGRMANGRELPVLILESRKVKRSKRTLGKWASKRCWSCREG